MAATRRSTQGKVFHIEMDGAQMEEEESEARGEGGGGLPQKIGNVGGT